jgi:polyisoprenoid-binding protein YceI
MSRNEELFAADLCSVNSTQTLNLQKMDTTNYIIDPVNSSIEWVGKKITGAHNGTVGIAEGVLAISDGRLTGGHFTIDTTSIRILDVTDPETNRQFAGHLASEDFFASEQHPRATLDITGVSNGTGGNYHVTGNLTIRAISQPVQFEAEVGKIQDGKLHAAAKVVIDRTKYNMKFRSGNFFKDLGDTLIYNDFTLNVLIAAKAA